MTLRACMSVTIDPRYRVQGEDDKEKWPLGAAHQWPVHTGVKGTPWWGRSGALASVTPVIHSDDDDVQVRDHFTTMLDTNGTRRDHDTELYLVLSEMGRPDASLEFRLLLASRLVRLFWPSPRLVRHLSQ